MAEDKRKPPDNAAAQFFNLIISYWLFFNLFIDSNIPVLISCNIFHFFGPDTFIYSYVFLVLVAQLISSKFLPIFLEGIHPYISEPIEG
ncbi:hypothetical protein T12_11966 [Trichinella patagoniensis]|uniref:Uncharacterized protein n=1 Tax=Trichinella patagoniensis TaxID=990121 RepID=A0A0V0ZBI6_9BILA|nr:hypothetical protein T12_11966 [Trichinella patagoniensis]